MAINKTFFLRRVGLLFVLIGLIVGIVVGLLQCNVTPVILQDVKFPVKTLIVEEIKLNVKPIYVASDHRIDLYIRIESTQNPDAMTLAPDAIFLIEDKNKDSFVPEVWEPSSQLDYVREGKLRFLKVKDPLSSFKVLVFGFGDEPVSLEWHL